IIRFAYNTNAIEGSTITLQETLLILKDKIAPSGKSLREIHEIENTKSALDFIEKCIEKKDLDENIILKIHKILMKSIDEENGGKWRTRQVIISGTDYMPPIPDFIPFAIREFLDWYSESKDKMHAVELAALVHLKFVLIHPFIDGNGRVSRLLMNYVLLKNQYPLLFISNRLREEYYNALEEGNKGNYDPFIEFILKLMLERLKFLVTILS
ncbi:MAG: Fic family protein, partial [Methanosarcinales archaeon]